ncbi:calcium-binding protein [Tsukamurella sp. 8F]|uniref:calcium-binding protein n=1 Tax=unclassified Tsukamurella TaxID=2633480 RepID=UPI0023B9717D|nr:MULTISPECIES: calcium-binding protein [unclassified Tsukamurella]MDF0530449.1 calcium-binding protein [Tsukamurella sp. 8J]MDF0587730.1 calcium-binding protein [Tsukamurella sp. 8F]
MKITIRRILAASAAAAALLIAAACGGGSSDTASTATQAAGPTGASATTAASAAAGDGHYKAGTYDVEGHYTNPAGPAKVDVQLTIDSAGTVESVKVTPEPTNPNSRQFQTQFAGGISSVVVGKKIDSLSVSKVAGSSLTGGGFNDAVKQIIGKAKA